MSTKYHYNWDAEEGVVRKYQDNKTALGYFLFTMQCVALAAIALALYFVGQ